MRAEVGISRTAFKASMWHILCYGVSIVSIAGLQLERGVSVRMLIAELFFACVFGVLAVCVDLILGREGEQRGSMLESVRPAMFVQFFVLGVASMNISELFTVPETYGKGAFMLLIYAVIAAPSLLLLKTTLNLLVTERESEPYSMERE